MAPEGGVRRKWQGQKPLIFMRFHEVSLGNQHKIWSKQHNGKVRLVRHVWKPRRIYCVQHLVPTACCPHIRRLGCDTQTLEGQAIPKEVMHQMLDVLRQE